MKEVRGALLVSSKKQHKYMSKNDIETIDIGFRLGKILKPGDIVGLYGELGAGKTTMIKGIAKAFGLNERDILSASFTIIADYNTNPPFIHVDLYRIRNYSELEELGLWDYLKEDNILVIEWAEKVEKELSGNLIKVKIKSINENMREIIIEGIDEHKKDRNNF